MSNSDRNLLVKDVYDNACDIFQEFEKIVAITGVEEASLLINKVKHVLELLEESVRRTEQLDKEYVDLKLKCTHLSADKLMKEEEILSLKQAFEELEDSWVQESSNLKTIINKLSTENNILKQTLAEKKDVPLEVDHALKSVIKDQEKVISKLKSNLKQKDDRFEKDQATLDSMNTKIIHLSKVNTSLHLRYQEAQKVIAAYKDEKRQSEEKITFQTEKLQNMEDSFDDLKKSIEETCEFSLQNMIDVYKPLQQRQCNNEDKMKTLYDEQKKLKQEVKDLKLELALLQIEMDEYEQELSRAPARPNRDCLNDHGNLDQMFRLFLGVFADNPQTCVLRGKRMYSK
ncbi:RILP-like protein 1 [Parasteatoda tepidariorum]|uniref:RILP-like protein 1 n=1 Tax=Parasteatoda tepidariorum TaxID=114398 RepID=UPI001C71A740|nr:RILP-like protein 1 [Parasteatoda tepidariorum]